MTQNSQQEIEKELLTFSGQTFSSSEEVLEWLDKAFNRIVEKTVEAVRVEEKSNVAEVVINGQIYPIKENLKLVLEKVFNSAVDEQNKKASAWLGKDN